jgi:magnesium chelatase subunit H
MWFLSLSTRVLCPPLFAAIHTNNAEVAFEVSGYLIEELRSQENYEAFKQDVAAANIFIGSLIFH